MSDSLMMNSSIWREECLLYFYFLSLSYHRFLNRFKKISANTICDSKSMDTNILCGILPLNLLTKKTISRADT